MNRRVWLILAFLGTIAASACTGSPATLATAPDFELATPAGIAGVSIRESPPGMPHAEFVRLVSRGMGAALHSSLIDDHTTGPFPSRRIVWHVNQVPARGVSRLMVNAFRGPDPFAYQEQIVDNSAPSETFVAAIASLTRRLSASLG